MEDRIKRAYRERTIACVLAANMAIKAGYSAGVGKDDNEDWDDEWRIVLYCESPYGQFSWHIAPDDQDLIKDFPEYNAVWDGVFRSRTGEGMIK